MITVFTICSANYLAHAKTLGNSLLEHNPDYQFVIGLVDRLPERLQPTFWHPYEMVPVEELGIPAFWDMVQKYDIVELNTAVKPFYMEYLYKSNPAVDAVIYLDPDILVCGSFKRLCEKLQTHNIVVTPHSSTFDQSPDSLYYEERMLTMGIYNLGFLATSRSKTAFAFLNWWQKRLESYCYSHPGSGKFVDQLWVTLAPVYFPDVLVERDPGYNVSYWNHFERHLSHENGRYRVNAEHDLVFYHFSGYNPTKPEAMMTRTNVRVRSFAERPDLKPIYDDYRNRLLAEDYISIKTIPWAIPRRPPVLTPKRATKEGLRVFLHSLPISFQALLKRAAQLTANALK
jgi:lipopolysaccharide biosynthesis glycosyltransferase